mmetsp:Transcript_51312/g.144568  ORF Transcript_51312/g.144568 Transcript_51312/m.144568 type:complete len:357 (-) Transcript_51312:740-1810(-)
MPIQHDLPPGAHDYVHEEALVVAREEGGRLDALEDRGLELRRDQVHEVVDLERERLEGLPQALAPQLPDHADRGGLDGHLAQLRQAERGELPHDGACPEDGQGGAVPERRGLALLHDEHGVAVLALRDDELARQEEPDLQVSGEPQQEAGGAAREEVVDREVGHGARDELLGEAGAPLLDDVQEALHLVGAVLQRREQDHAVEDEREAGLDDAHRGRAGRVVGAAQDRHLPEDVPVLVRRDVGVSQVGVHLAPHHDVQRLALLVLPHDLVAGHEEALLELGAQHVEEDVGGALEEVEVAQALRRDDVRVPLLHERREALGLEGELHEGVLEYRLVQDGNMADVRSDDRGGPHRHQA